MAGVRGVTAASLFMLLGVMPACERPAARVALEPIRVLAGGPIPPEFLAIYQSLLPGVQLSSEVTRGSVFVVDALQKGTADVGLAQADVVYAAYRTLPRDESRRPSGQLRGIAVGQSVNVYLVVRRDSPFRKVRDLRQRRIGIALKGTRAEHYERMILGAYGLDDASARIESHAQPELAARIAAGTIDAAAFGGPGIPEQMALANERTGIRLLELRGDVITKLRGSSPFFNPVIVTPQELAGQVGNVQTLGVDSLLVCRQDLRDDRVYALTRAFFETFDRLATENPAFPTVDPDRAPATPIPLHPGAARYYREREVLR